MTTKTLSIIFDYQELTFLGASNQILAEIDRDTVRGR